MLPIFRTILYSNRFNYFDYELHEIACIIYYFSEVTTLFIKLYKHCTTLIKIIFIN